MLFSISHQMLGRLYRHPLVSDMTDGPMPGVAGDMLSVSDDWDMIPFPPDVGGMINIPDDMDNMYREDARIWQTNITLAAFSSVLLNATPRDQYFMLGEHLLPLVDELEHENAPKITGMILELPQAEVLHLLVSAEALNAKVAEAMEILRSVQQPNSSAD